jgi:phosphoribosylformylglycinamidine synthase PurS subunit
MYLANIYVTLKPTVNDPQGLTVRGGLHNLGFHQVNKVRQGKFIELWLEETNQKKAEKQVAEMCDKLLANPIIENFRFELEKADGG